MTPAEHYAEAERILADGKTAWEEIIMPIMTDPAKLVSNSDFQSVAAALTWSTARAQVHATLACVPEVVGREDQTSS